jgi:phosphoglycerol transferase MdoB-like AlkP superfamily enzyme
MKKIKDTLKKFTINPAVYYLISLIYLEIIMKVIICKQILNTGLIYTTIFLVPFILLFTILTKAFNEKINRIIMTILLAVITIYYEVQLIFFGLFSVPFSFSTIGLASQAFDFVTIVKDAILVRIIPFILILLPFIIRIILRKKINCTRYHKYTIISLIIMFIISYLLTFVYLQPNKKDDYSANKLYYNLDDQTSIIDKFGLLTYTKIDIKRQLVGYESEIIVEKQQVPTKKEEVLDEVVYGDNILDIDFKESGNKNINNLNNYVQNQTPTNQSEYTGMFKGKNLIFILAEGFNEIAVDEQRTPTLYNMIHTGFNFTNFYSPVYLSTTGGEFQATTGLIPTQEILKLWKKEQPTIEFALGNAFGRLGYRAQSYHNWTYTYYKRNITMKTLGFNNYKGCGNGLEKEMDCHWLPYDSTMAEVTSKNYLGKEDNFVTYYVTVSGHSPYNTSDNIAKHHWDTVKDLNYSDPVKYYLAAQVELDKMLEKLVEKLKESGELDNTVIALVGDHYPYTLTNKEMNEASSYKKDDTIEVNHSNFILWNSEIKEPITVDKVGSQIDVLPTLLNLFGVEYDSRMIVGKDILSDYEGIAMFSNHSWVTDYGWYQASTRTFTKKEGKTLENETEQEYIKRMNNRVTNAFSISKLIIDNDYYKYILGK